MESIKDRATSFAYEHASQIWIGVLVIIIILVAVYVSRRQPFSSKRKEGYMGEDELDKLIDSIRRKQSKLNSI